MTIYVYSYYQCQCHVRAVYHFLIVSEQMNVSSTHPVLLYSFMITSFCYSIGSMTFVHTHTHTYAYPYYCLLFPFLSSSLSLSLSLFCANRSLLYSESRIMVLLVIMTFIYHIRSVMPFAHTYIYI